MHDFVKFLGNALQGFKDAHPWKVGSQSSIHTAVHTAAARVEAQRIVLRLRHVLPDARHIVTLLLGTLAVICFVGGI